jgi:hypothetical protein
MAIGDFEGTTPPFLPEEFFNGRLEGRGALESLVPAKAEHNHRRRLLGTHEQAVHFTEIYRFDAGHQDSLRWTIRKLGRGVYRGAEARSVGEAVGEQAGCAFEMIDLSALRPYPKMRDAILARR